MLIAVNVIRGGKRIDCGAAILAKFDCDAEFYNRKVFDPAANAVDLHDRPPVETAARLFTQTSLPRSEDNSMAVLPRDSMQSSWREISDSLFTKR